MLARQEALDLLRTHVKTEALVKHSLATEAIMRALARKMGQDEALWGVTGLLHDLDFDTTKDAPDRHGLETAAILADVDLPPEAVEAIKGHNAEGLGIERSGDFATALTAAETITGLVVATALVYPDKKIASVKAKSIKKRMKEKAFARNVNRDHIRLCETVGIPLPEFIDLSLAAMGEVAGDLGL
jgi:putative nucleotidyltransferase with HDIG domain